MNNFFLRLCLFAGLFVDVAGSSVTEAAVSPDTAINAINAVFARYPKGKKEVWPISGYPRYTLVRPLLGSTFAPLREYFSPKQQRNVNAFLQALADLINARDQLAKNLDIHEKWWPTGIDLLKIDALLTQDLLTGRTDAPDNISNSGPRSVNGKLQGTVEETYTEHGQDRVLGRGHRTSIVTLIPEDNRWVIDEIATTIIDASGETQVKTLSQRLQNATKALRATKRAIEKLPKTLEVKKGVKVQN